ncbi:Heme oxygenase [Halopseudomonas xinjiangensis]|uniref:Heme oxygenase n=1 Tax=Halopseudomonas xinjiangensis TaxID=487184 RepID=A0A1H1N7R5_9GAMM|nr:biliverdin-producing heme oxygenase [Halopseudomonas xinjiangensis]SDR94967.1 Heme oxygenase [Halopseudomonas xinjiangensis]
MTRSTDPSPALAALRDATRTLHSDLDQLSPLNQDTLQTGSYLHHAARVLGWMHPLEHALWHAPMAASLPAQFAVEKRRDKSAWLERDLLDGGYSSLDVANIPHCPYIASPSNQAELLGMAYVAEGATLGGTFLRKRWAGRFDGLSLRWLQGYGAETGTMWKTFLHVLAVQVTTPAEIADAQRAAQTTFLSFRRWVIDEADIRG